MILLVIQYGKCDVKCPGGVYVCPNKWTCCPVGQGVYACCPYN